MLLLGSPKPAGIIRGVKWAVREKSKTEESRVREGEGSKSHP